jgi:hypothetical protein
MAIGPSWVDVRQRIRPLVLEQSGQAADSQCESRHLLEQPAERIHRPVISDLPP